jgi:hypothetical protein
VALLKTFSKRGWYLQSDHAIALNFLIREHPNNGWCLNLQTDGNEAVNKVMSLLALLHCSIYFQEKCSPLPECRTPHLPLSQK